jgi:hypothetical protein
MSLESLTLANASGGTVSLISAPINAEFMHVNGVSEPLITVSIPQGTYTSASASIENAGFTCVTLNQSGVLYTSYFGYQGALPASDVTVSLPAPLMVSGASAVLAFDLLFRSRRHYQHAFRAATRLFWLRRPSS